MVCREADGEASVGAYTGRLIESRKLGNPERRRLWLYAEGNMSRCENASACSALRGHRGRHVYTFLVREPGGLRIGHQVIGGPRREGDEP